MIPFYEERQEMLHALDNVEANQNYLNNKLLYVVKFNK